jgi:uncharacterized membrane protein YfcA
LSSAIAGAACWHFGWRINAVGDVVGLPESWAAVSLVIFAAASISSTVGFAFSAIAAAMIFHFVPDHIEAIQIMMIASIAIQAYSVASLFRTISWRTCAPFLIGGIATIPAGIFLLLSIQPQAYVVATGLALTLYGTYMLFRRPPTIKKGGIFADMAVGALGGITGPLAAFPGAFLTIWCGMLGWDKVVQRSVYQPFILIIQVLTLGALAFADQRTAFNPELLTYALPGIAGACLGLHVFRKLTDSQFQKFVNIALIVSGVALFIK